MPLGLNGSLFAFGHLFMQAAINAQGSVFMAGCSVANKIIGLANVAISAFSSAGATFSGQNLGAGNYKRLKEGAWKIPLFGGAIILFVGLIVTFVLRNPLLMLFTREEEVLYYASRYIIVVLPSTCLYVVFNTMIHYANGLGLVKYPTVINLTMLWMVRIPIVYAIAFFMDGTYCMVAIPISFLYGLIGMLGFFRTKGWKRIEMQAKSVSE